MKSALFMILLLSGLTTMAKPDCRTLDTLFDDGTAYLCQSQKYGPTCIRIGYHDSVKKDGIRIFSTNKNVSTTKGEIDKMVFHAPVWHRCHLSILKGCTHEKLSTSSKFIEAYRYKAPDAWDARSHDFHIKLDIKNGSAKIKTRHWDTKGDIDNLQTATLYSCKEQFVE